MTWILGLTGGAGSGKSTAAKTFSDVGIPVVDADAVSRSLTAAGGAAMPEIIEAFGPEMATADGALDRPRMRELVFSDPSARAKLEEIVHGRMAVILDEEFAAKKALGAPFIVYDCPLLFESPAALARVDRVLVIDVPEYVQIERLGTRSGLSVEAAKRLLAAQTSRKTKLQRADDIIVNLGTKEDLEERVREYAQRLIRQTPF